MTTDPRELAAVRGALDELAERDAPRRLRDRDPSLFSDERGTQEQIAHRLGWLDCVPPPPAWHDQVRRIAEAVRDDGLTETLLLGMGGSSLAPEVLARVIGPQPGGMPLAVLDSTHPQAVERAVDRDLSRTLVIVASKSGTTPETTALAALAAERTPGPEHLVALTDADTSLAGQAASEGWRETVLNPADIGGRFSALSLVGMLPAALLGVDIDALWASAERMRARTAPGTSVAEDPAALLGAYIGGLARQGRDKLTICTDPTLEPIGDWIEQLVAESTGKQGRGVVPIVGEPLGPPAVYGPDRVFVELRLGGQPVDGVAKIAEAGHPVLTLDIADLTDIGGAFWCWEVATAYAGALLGVNPFDEPDVAATKANTSALLADIDTAGGPPPEDADPTALLANLQPGDYVALQAYLPSEPATVAALTRLRLELRDRHHVATTVGLGPRFLHSTGQLHKGGPDSVAVLQLADSASGGPTVPGRPYGFATLVRAQAAGDLQALRERGRRVCPVRVHGSVEATVERLLGG